LLAGILDEQGKSHEAEQVRKEGREEGRKTEGRKDKFSKKRQ
jgi:hypothetical protein